MSLVKCHECEKVISLSAKTCPGCGATVVKRANGSTKFIYVLGAITALILAAQSSDRDQEKNAAASLVASQDAARVAAMTPEQKAVAAKYKAEEDAAAAKRATAFNRAQALVALVRKSANDPESIKVSEALYTEDGSVLVEFRGKNAFGASIINYAIAAKDGSVVSGSKKEVATLWNRHIANKPYDSLPKPP